MKITKCLVTLQKYLLPPTLAWWWWRQVLLKCQQTSSRSYGTTTQRRAIFIKFLKFGFWYICKTVCASSCLIYILKRIGKLYPNSAYKRYHVMVPFSVCWKAHPLLQSCVLRGVLHCLVAFCSTMGQSWKWVAWIRSFSSASVIHSVAHLTVCTISHNVTNEPKWLNNSSTNTHTQEEVTSPLFSHSVNVLKV
jgi:hypothetical protein